MLLCTGCLDALTVDEAITTEARKWRNNLSVAWIDYQKAYDRTPHPWIRDMLKAIKAPKLVRRAIGKIIPKWRTNIELQGAEGKIRIPIGGLYQGDSLSPLLFCLSVAPLSTALRVGGESADHPPALHG